MIQTVFGLLLLILLAFVGHHRPFDRPHWPVWVRFFFLSGTVFVFIGLALGELFLGLLDQPTIGRLTPLFSLGLGYFGLIFGLQFEWAKIRRFSYVYLASTAVQAAVTFLLVFALFFGLLAQVESLFTALIAAVVVGAVACCSSPSLTALLIQGRRLRQRPEIDLIRYISGFDAMIGFILFGIAACLTPAAVPPPGLPYIPAALQWMAASLIFGASMGFLLHLLTQVHCAENELWVFIIGIIVFAGGVSLFFGISPLFVNMVAGMTAANLPGSKDRVFVAIFRQEKPFHLIFLILAGAVWRPDMVSALSLAAVYVLARIFGKLCGGWIAARYVAGSLRVSPWIGSGLISQSGVAVAMTMEVYLSGCRMAELLVAMLISAIIANELVSPALAKPVMKLAADAPS